MRCLFDRLLTSMAECDLVVPYKASRIPAYEADSKRYYGCFLSTVSKSYDSNRMFECIIIFSTKCEFISWKYFGKVAFNRIDLHKRCVYRWVISNIRHIDAGVAMRNERS